MTTTATTTTTATASTVLDKPLHALTEDDISQLTREDCRRFLKSKGMRRPSWNKSQAIQQVIALKALLEPPSHPPPPPPDLSPPEIPPAPLVASNSSSPVKETSPVDVEARSGSNPMVEADPLRDVDVSNLSVGQMTIFYCGKVNVYDRVPAEKAQTIMQLAASSIHLLQDELIDGNSAQWRSPGQFPGSGVKVSVIPAGTTVSNPVQTGKMRDYIQQDRQERNVPHEAVNDGQTNRQVSLQRYLEKRKDRGRFKVRKKIGPSSSGLEMYLNQQTRMQVVSGQSSPNDVSSPTQAGMSHVQCTSNENQSKHVGCGADLNN